MREEFTGHHPPYNERENIDLVIKEVLLLPNNFDMLVMDDGSPNGTGAIVKELQLKYNSDPNTRLHQIEHSSKLGLGTAYIERF